MWVFPLAAAAVAAVFAGLLGRQFVAKRRAFQLVWTVALLMYAAASFAMFLGVLRGWSTGEYRVYWTFGAVLNVPYLFLGEVYLLVRRRAVSDAVLVVLLFLTAFTIASVGGATVHTTALSPDLPLGREVFGDGTVPYRLAQYLAYPAFVFLIGACLWSIRQMRGRPESGNRMAGTLLIAVGATIVAVGSGVGAGYDVVPVFSAGLLAGIAVMFAGFLRASRPVTVAAGTPA